MKISVVIPHENREKQLSFCLAALDKQTMCCQDYEIIISGKIEQSVLENRKYKILFAEHNRIENTGFNASLLRNTGAKLAQGKVLVFLDCDMIMAPDFLSQVWKLHKDKELLSFCTRRKLGKEIEIRRVEDVKHEKYQRDERENVLAFFDGKSENIKSLWMWAFSHTLCIDRGSFEKYGGFREDFLGWGLEDTEFSYRYYKVGIPVVYNKKGVGYHLWHEENFDEERRSGYEKNLHIFQKNYSEAEIQGLNLCEKCLEPKIVCKLTVRGIPCKELSLFLYEAYIRGCQESKEE